MCLKHMFRQKPNRNDISSFDPVPRGDSSMMYSFVSIDCCTESAKQAFTVIRHIIHITKKIYASPQMFTIRVYSKLIAGLM